MVCVDDPIAAELAERVDRGRLVTYGTSPAADLVIGDVGGDGGSVRFTVTAGGRRLAEVEVPQPGLHTARNATAALATAVEIGVDAAEAAAALADFGGVARRFERRGEQAGVTFVDDYAHLPTEVAAAIQAARSGDWRRVVAVFQPHRYTRTAELWDAFADAFTAADVLAVTDVYPAGEAPIDGVSGKLVVDAVLDAHPRQRVAWLPSLDDATRWLGEVLRPGDLCLSLGAGDVTRLPELVKPVLEQRGTR